jgi:hypothetical protein
MGGTIPSLRVWIRQQDPEQEALRRKGVRHPLGRAAMAPNHRLRLRGPHSSGRLSRHLVQVGRVELAKGFEPLPVIHDQVPFRDGDQAGCPQSL